MSLTAKFIYHTLSQYSITRMLSHVGISLLKQFILKDQLVVAMPKMVISSGGDEFFLPDDSQYFWNDLQGEKYRR